MDFSLTPEQSELASRARAASRNFAARAAAYDETSAFPEENFREIRAAGLHTMTVPKEYGGLGLWQGRNYLGYYLAIEEMSKACSSTAQLLQVHCHAVGYLAGELDRAAVGAVGPQVPQAGEGVRRREVGDQAPIRIAYDGFHRLMRAGFAHGAIQILSEPRNPRAA